MSVPRDQTNLFGAQHDLYCAPSSVRKTARGWNRTRKIPARLREPQRGRDSVLFSEHDGQHAGRFRRVARIVRSAGHAGVVVIDLPKELMLPDLQGTEVVLAVRIVVGREVFVLPNACDRFRYEI